MQNPPRNYTPTHNLPPYRVWRDWSWHAIKRNWRSFISSSKICGLRKIMVVKEEIIEKLNLNWNKWAFFYFYWTCQHGCWQGQLYCLASSKLEIFQWFLTSLLVLRKGPHEKILAVVNSILNSANILFWQLLISTGSPNLTWSQ